MPGALLRCRRCERMYDEDEPGECHYHPGRWAGTGVVALVPHWSCCGADSSQMVGCRIARDHVPCAVTRMVLESLSTVDHCLPTDEDPGDALAQDEESPSPDNPLDGATLVFSMPDGGATVATMVTGPGAASTAASECEGPEVETRAQDQTPTTTAAVLPSASPSSSSPPDDVVEERYVVLPGDTFSGVALRHGMTVQALADLNNVQTSRCVLPGQVLRVVRPRLAPEDEEERLRKELINRFKRVQRCPAEEAKYYLENHEFDYDAAIAERAADVAWERNHAERRADDVEAWALAREEAVHIETALRRVASARTVQPADSWWFRSWEKGALRRCLVGAQE